MTGFQMFFVMAAGLAAIIIFVYYTRDEVPNVAYVTIPTGPKDGTYRIRPVYPNIVVEIYDSYGRDWRNAGDLINVVRNYYDFENQPRDRRVYQRVQFADERSAELYIERKLLERTARENELKEAQRVRDEFEKAHPAREIPPFKVI